MTSQRPSRTCVGCRRRCPATELLRVVAAPGLSGGTPSVVPDPRRRMPGRGAWVHPVSGCVELAKRRRAYHRALRVPGFVDPAPVGEYVAELESHNANTPASGQPQEMKKRMDKR